MTVSTERLLWFVSSIEDDLGLINENANLFFLRGFVLIANALWRLRADRFERLRAALVDAGPEVEVRLSLVGLTGEELDLKLAAYEQARNNARGELDKPEKKPGWIARTLRPLFMSALGWANVILGSMKAVIPQAEAIKEMKEMFERGITDAQELPFEG